jgi:hypothetical protein
VQKDVNCFRAVNLKTKPLNLYIIVIQIVGVVFYAFFSAAYILAIPSINVLSGEPIFKVPLTVFGILFVALILASIVLSIAKNKKSSLSYQS